MILVSVSEQLDWVSTGALMLQGASSLGVNADEAARMLLGALRDPDPVAPSGLSSRTLTLSLTPSLSRDDALEEVTGCGRTGSDTDM